jgi:hypothetical protein
VMENTCICIVSGFFRKYQRLSWIATPLTDISSLQVIADENPDIIIPAETIYNRPGWFDRGTYPENPKCFIRIIWRSVHIAGFLRNGDLLKNMF